MGVFSWKFCDTKNRRRLKIGNPGYLLLPDNTFLYEPAYDGYGNFAGKDVYEMAAEWNRDFLSMEMVKASPEWESFQDGAEGDEHYERQKRRYQFIQERLDAYREKKLTDTEMKERFGEYWKREIGIDISCYDAQNDRLPFPIKIASKACQYKDMPASKSDPYQGL